MIPPIVAIALSETTIFTIGNFKTVEEAKAAVTEYVSNSANTTLDRFVIYDRSVANGGRSVGRVRQQTISTVKWLE